jgi:hypothetical protein
VVLAGIAAAAASTGVWIPEACFGAAALTCVWRTISDCGRAAAAIRRAVTHAQPG